MAQTRKRRQTKHRGNAAGMVEARGRTGRKPGDHERKLTPKEEAARRREERRHRPPSWSGAINRAAIATVLFMVLVIVVLKKPIGFAAAVGVPMLALYVPLGYYTDKLIHRRAQRKQAAAGKAA